MRSRAAGGTTQEIPGTAALNVGRAVYPNAVSCSSEGNCSAGGSYTDGSGSVQAFLTDYTPGPAVTRLSPGTGPAAGGTVVTITGTNLSNASAVHFGTAAAKIDKVMSDSEIKVTAP